MDPVALTQPLTFEPIFKERIWGGRRLEELFGKKLPAGKKIGESWEIVDREEAQSMVASGPLADRTLHELWREHRSEIFGHLPETERFPLLIKLLDADEKLSLQVHPPPEVAAALGGEAKTEFWYIADARPGAELYVGLKQQSSRSDVSAALETGAVADHVHRIAVRTGDAMFLPSGRMHAIGGGNVIVEIQQNSDTTFRVFDWNRTDETGERRELHIEESMQSIDFDDIEPALVTPDGERLVENEFFSIEKWTLTSKRAAATPGRFAVVACLSGEVVCAGVAIKPGSFFLVPATMRDRSLEPRAHNTSLLRITVGPS
jgi:mannose-6-phosphate isomerase